MKKIAIIGGAGKMGRWLAGFLLKEGCDVVLADTNPDKLKEAGIQLGAATADDNLKAIKDADYVLICVPIESVRDVVNDLGGHLKAGQAMLDISSVKVKPVEIMHKYVKAGTALGAHPLFGPGATTITNKNFALTPTTDAETALALKIKKWLEERGGIVALMSPKEHDEMMSLVLGLSHFISLVAADTLLSAKELRPMAATGSSTYKVLLTLIESVVSEDPELYASIQMNLPDVTRFEKLFLQRTGEWAELVAAKDRREFVRRMNAVKEKLALAAPDFEKSYEKLYRIVEGL